MNVQCLCNGALSFYGRKCLGNENYGFVLFFVYFFRFFCIVCFLFLFIYLFFLDFFFGGLLLLVCIFVLMWKMLFLFIYLFIYSFIRCLLSLFVFCLNVNKMLLLFNFHLILSLFFIFDFYIVDCILS